MNAKFLDFNNFDICNEKMSQGEFNYGLDSRQIRTFCFDQKI